MNKGEIWLLELPSLSGHEQSGKRPSIILACTDIGMVTIIPLTSNPLANRFPHIYQIKKSQANKLEKDSIALIFQIQTLDKKRFLKKIGMVEESYLKEIDKILKEFLKL